MEIGLEEYSILLSTKPIINTLSFNRCEIT